MTRYEELFTALIQKVEFFKKQEKKIVLCHGCFDPLHIGHVLHFRAAKRLGDVLIVTVTPDHFINKGENRPIFTSDLRLEMIKELKTVDACAVNLWESAVPTIRRLKPDVLAKGNDYASLNNCNPNIMAEKEVIESCGGKLMFTDEKSFSSSRLIDWINKC